MSHHRQTKDLYVFGPQEEYSTRDRTFPLQTFVAALNIFFPSMDTEILFS